MNRKSVSSLYVRHLRSVLKRPLRVVAIFVATALHAAGHAALALAAAGAAVALATHAGLDGAGSTPALGRAVSLALVGLGAVAVKVVAGTYASSVQARLAGEVASEVRVEVLRALLALHRLRLPRHADQGVEVRSPRARDISALTDRVKDVELGLEHGVLGGARAVMQAAAIAVVLVVLAPKLALAAAVVMVPFSLGLGAARSWWKRANVRAARARESLLEAADEAVRHADLWVAYGAGAKVERTVATLGDEIAANGAWLEASRAALSGANELLGALAVLAALGAATAGWLGEVGGGGALVAFVVAFFMAYRPLRDLAEARLAFARAAWAAEELESVTAGSNDASTEGETPRVAWPLAPLEVRGVALARGAASGRIDFRVEPGSIVAIVGATGAGKSTLLRVSCSELEAPLAGEVRYDGVSIVAAPAGPASRPFAWVPQDAPLLAATLAENVGLGAESSDAATAAVEQVGATRLAREIGDARLGAAGRALSGGERQWVGLARALATDLPVLVLDEPTSGLDPRSQDAVLALIQSLRGARSVILVTHRREPLAIADLVVDLDALDAPVQSTRMTSSSGAAA